MKMPKGHAVPDALGRHLEECTEATGEPGEGEDGNDAHSQHEFEGMKIGGRHGSTARRALPAFYSAQGQLGYDLSALGIRCQEMTYDSMPYTPGACTCRRRIGRKLLGGLLGR